MSSCLVSRRAVLRACPAGRLPADDAATDSAASFGARIGSETARWKPVVERANMNPD